ncbi:MAG: type II secretion system protein [Desulforegulaceae bacterium]|nr:type II secretion system protein [Desulforegulaceae bacterium]
MKNKGFTLIELLMAILVFSIVSAVISSTFKNELTAYVNQKKFSEMMSQLRILSHFISNDLKTSGFNPIDASGVEIEVAEKDYFSFVRVNDEFKTSGDLKRIALYKCGDKILRYVANTETGFDWEMPSLSSLCSSASYKYRTPDELAFGISELEFLYYNRDGNLISQQGLDNQDKNLFSKISSIEVSIKSEINYWGKKQKTESFRFFVQCRNLGI